LSKEKVTTTPPDDSLPEVNVDSEVNLPLLKLKNCRQTAGIVRRGRPTLAKPLLEIEEDVDSFSELGEWS